MTIKIGIELEFMVAYCSTDKVRSRADRQDLRWPESEQAAADPHDFNSRDFANNECLYKVCSVLAAYGLPVACGVTSDVDMQRATTAAHGGQVVYLGNKRHRVWNSHKVNNQVPNPRFQYWFVTHESYITGKMVNNPTPYTPGGYSWYCVEINTPVIDDSVELDYGLPVVCAAIEELRREIKIYVNEDCGLHIHASPSNGPLSHDIARGVAALTYLLENSVVYKACHRFRSTSAFCQPISEASQIGQGGYGFILEDNFSAACMNEIRAVKRNMPKTIDNEQDTFQKIHTLLAQSSLTTLHKGIRNSVDSKMGLTM